MKDNDNVIKESVKERLLLAGIHEIELHGFNDFSLRRVASACNLSCAAPYRHFKGKEDLLQEILKYIDSRWNLMREEVIDAFDNDIKSKLIEVATQYVRFLIVTPSYFSIIFHEIKTKFFPRTGAFQALSIHTEKTIIGKKITLSIAYIPSQRLYTALLLYCVERFCSLKKQ